MVYTKDIKHDTGSRPVVPNFPLPMMLPFTDDEE